MSATSCVSQAESEEVFFNRPVLLLEEAKHSGRERRYNVLGRTNGDRVLSVIFTIRGTLVRVYLKRCSTTSPVMHTTRNRLH